MTAMRKVLQALAVAALALPLGARAAACPATNEATLLACAASAADGDTITFATTITLSGAPIVVPAGVTVTLTGTRLQGTILKDGPGTLVFALTNPLGTGIPRVEARAGTISMGTAQVQSPTAWIFSGGRYVATGGGIVVISGNTINFAAGTSSTVSAEAGTTIFFQPTVTLELEHDSVATFGDPLATGSVNISQPATAYISDPTAEFVAGGGTVVIGRPNSLPLLRDVGFTTVNAGATLRNNGDPLTINNLRGTGTFQSQLNLNTILTGTSQFDGLITGFGSLEIAGGAEITFTGNHTYTGGTTVGGTLNLGAGGTSGALPPASVVTILGNFLSGAIVNVNRSNVYDMPNPLTTGGRLFMSGPGDLRLSGPSTRTSGQTYVRGGGTVTIANPLATAGGGAVINQFRIEDGRLHFVVGVSDVRLQFAHANARLTVAAGVTVNPLSMGISNMTDRYLIGDPVNSGTFAIDVPLSGFSSFTNFSTAFRVEGGTVRFGNTFFNSATDAFGSTYVAAGATIEVNATPGTVRLRNLQGDGRLLLGTATNLRGPTNFNGRIEGVGTLTLAETTILTGDNSGYSGSLNVNASLNVGVGGSTGTLGTGLVFVNDVLTVDRAGALTMANVFQSSGTIVKSGAGTLTLSGASPFNGPVNVQAGVLSLTGSIAGTITNNARLMGTGSAAAVNSSGSFAPGLSPGLFTVDSLNLAAGTLEVEISGLAAGTQYDQVRANIGASVGGALNVALGYAPATGDVFRIVDNLGPSATAGTFAGLPEGAIVTAGASKFRISYAGGTGNDITLTVLAVPSAPTITNVTLPTTSSALVTFSVPASDGGSAILDYTAQCGARTATGPASPLTVGGLPAGPVTCVVRARNAVGTSVDSAPFSITPGRFTGGGTSPTGTGTIAANLTGGGGACEFSVDPSFIPLTGDPLSPPAGTGPSNVQFPHGLFAFDAGGCAPGSTVTIVLTYPQTLPDGTQYWKYGPTAAAPAPHWYTVPATIAGNTITLSIVDGGLGDDDLAANGAISDPGGPGIYVRPPPPVASVADAYQALWWAGPQESGWGINTTHQGNILFATWFTYGANGEGQWYLMSRAERTGPGVYTGTIYTTRGPAFNAVPFDPKQVEVTEVGTGTFTFSSTTAGKFDYTVNGITQTKPLTRTEFGNAIPECFTGGAPSAIVNYQDTWWNASESGWGLNITHQGDLIFATWFTYDLSGKAQWLLMSNVRRVGLGDQFTGSIHRAKGNPFNTLPWNVGSIQTTEVGQVTLTFSDREHGTFAYTLDGVAQVKNITRQEFASPKATCSFR
ncbi:hypothetical protein DSM104443_02451 [Usitatibacter rugosus]|uniref:Fibronectin type-III domain-containing protein n=1 Tax=Usitatibacter rugosus TaxID=2732067 RepID=A0A6M4GW03_9PROT|nr:choice-of-anchor U domain-containing protein [Usitatibacter rugosus]QJR11376.1 hypothetical protein DSM104443_02451 [Usitatibacter rugosus]